MTVQVFTGDCRKLLRTLPDKSMNCIVTSPPYFGLRDYGMAEQLGLEVSPEAFVCELVAVFADARRVLRDDGTLWLNLGDSYASNKDLIGIPWRVAFAVQADGWYLRQDIIWHKPNPMPESVQDRCTKSHEYIFLFSKSPRYFFDAKAIEEQAVGGAKGSEFHSGKTAEHQLGRASTKRRKQHSTNESFVPGAPDHSGLHREGSDREPLSRNKRSVWTIATQPYGEAHFATMAPELAKTCIMAGCPVGGTVLDPFGGAGTTGLVADRLGRNAILIELNPAYADLARNRIQDDAGMFGAVA